MRRFLAWGRTDDTAGARQRMVDEQVAARGIVDERVLDALRTVPRHLFVPEAWRHEAYADSPLPIGHEQTISQPYIVAFMSEALALDATHRVLEIGTGSGYQTAVLGLLAREVWSVEISAPLAREAATRLAARGYRNVHVRCADGHAGWPEEAPFDRIIVTAAPREVPSALVAQLTEGGLLVIPVGEARQTLQVLRRRGDELDVLQTLGVRFVPMTGGVATRTSSEGTRSGMEPTTAQDGETVIATAHFILYVADQARSAAFYAAVLQRAPRLDVPGMTEFVLSDGAVLGLMPAAGARRLLGDAALDPATASRAPRAELYLLLDDPAAALVRALAAGAAPVSDVTPRDWGHDAGYCLDPDGHVLAVARVRA